MEEALPSLLDYGLSGILLAIAIWALYKVSTTKDEIIAQKDLRIKELHEKRTEDLRMYNQELATVLKDSADKNGELAERVFEMVNILGDSLKK